MPWQRSSANQDGHRERFTKPEAVGKAHATNMGENGPKINNLEATCAKEMWQRAEREAWLRQYGARFRNFARAAALAVTKREIGIRFRDGRVRVTPSQLADGFGCSLDCIQDGFRDLVPLVVDTPPWDLGLLKTRDATPGRGGVEQEWQLPCLVHPPAAVVEWFEATATGNDRSKRSNNEENNRLNRSKTDITAPGGYHSSCCVDTSYLHNNHPSMAMDHGHGLAGGGLEMAGRRGLSEQQEAVLGHLVSVGVGLDSQGAWKAAAAVHEPELLGAPLPFWVEERRLAGQQAHKTPEGLLRTRLLDARLRARLVERARRWQKIVGPVSPEKAPSAASKSPRNGAPTLWPPNPLPECDGASATLWKVVRAKLEKQMQEASFKEWIHPLVCGGMKPGTRTLVVLAPSMAAQLWVTDQLGEEFAAAIRGATAALGVEGFEINCIVPAARVGMAS